MSEELPGPSESASTFALTESPKRVPSSPEVNPNFQIATILDNQYKGDAPINLHPLIRPLTISDLESVEVLENTAFTNPEERATRAKIMYRLTKCGELCLGLFTTVIPNSGFCAPTLATSAPVELSRENGAVSVLIGHIIAAKTHDLTASDRSMDYPLGWDGPQPSASPLGHQEAGRTVVLHSVAILPQFQGLGLGSVLLQAYIQHIAGSGIADRLALIAHDHKADFYQKFGFENTGPSNASFGGGGWLDMIYKLSPLEPRVRYG